MEQSESSPSLAPPVSTPPFPSPLSLPTTTVKAADVFGIPTTATAQLFSDRTVLLLSQLSGRVGTLLGVSVEDSIIDNSRSFHVTVLLGRRDDAVIEVMARRIAERIAEIRGGKPGSVGDGCDVACPPMLVGIALKRREDKVGKLEPEEFRELVDLVVGTYEDATEMVMVGRG